MRSHGLMSSRLLGRKLGRLEFRRDLAKESQPFGRNPALVLRGEPLRGAKTLAKNAGSPAHAAQSSLVISAGSSAWSMSIVRTQPCRPPQRWPWARVIVMEAAGAKAADETIDRQPMSRGADPMKKQKAPAATAPIVARVEKNEPDLRVSLDVVDHAAEAESRRLSRLHTKIEIGAALSVGLAAGAVFAALFERAAARRARTAVPTRKQPLTVIGSVLHSTLLSNAFAG